MAAGPEVGLETNPDPNPTAFAAEVHEVSVA